MSMHKTLSVKSRVRGDFHARFCERVRVKLPRSTRPQMLAVQMHDVLNHLLAVEQAVQEVYQQVLVGCCSEYAFETEVGEQTNVSFFSGCHHIASLIVLLRQSYNENLKPPNLWQELSMEFQRIVPTNKHIPVLPCGDITSSKKSMST